MSEDQEQLDEELRKLNDDFLQSSILITPDKLFIDLALLKDFRIGTLLSFFIHSEDGEERFSYIKSKLDEYGKRAFDDIAHYFPELGLTNEQITVRMRDHVYSDIIFALSPITKFKHTLAAQLAVNVNHSAVKQKLSPIMFVINTYPLKLNRTNTDILGTYISNGYGVSAAIEYRDYTSISPDYLAQFDELYVYYTDELLRNESVNKAFTDLVFLKKRIYGPKLFGYTYDPSWNIKQDEAITKSFLDVVTTFSYLDMDVISASLDD